MTHHGGCKCGAVAFEVEGEIDKVMACNCSICRPKGYLHWFVPETRFRATKGREEMSSYRFNKGVLDHRFCGVCGVSPFVEGPGSVAVNVRCLQGVDPETLTVEQYDGAHLR